MRLAVVIVITVFGLLVLWGSRFVWIPDLVSGKEVVVGSLPIRPGESIELTQVWAGDGYLTRLRHKLSSGRSLYAFGDPDSRKAWKCRLDHQTNLACVRIRFNGK